MKLVYPREFKIPNGLIIRNNNPVYNEILIAIKFMGTVEFKWRNEQAEI